MFVALKRLKKNLRAHPHAMQPEACGIKLPAPRRDFEGLVAECSYH